MTAERFLGLMFGGNFEAEFWSSSLFGISAELLRPILVKILRPKFGRVLKFGQDFEADIWSRLLLRLDLCDSG